MKFWVISCPLDKALYLVHKMFKIAVLLYYSNRKTVLHKPQTALQYGFSCVPFGGDKRDRTADLLNAIQALSQLSYTPKFSIRKLGRFTAFVLLPRCLIIIPHFFGFCNPFLQKSLIFFWPCSAGGPESALSVAGPPFSTGPQEKHSRKRQTALTRPPTYITIALPPFCKAGKA